MRGLKRNSSASRMVRSFVARQNKRPYEVMSLPPHPHQSNLPNSHLVTMKNGSFLGVFKHGFTQRGGCVQVKTKFGMENGTSAEFLPKSHGTMMGNCCSRGRGMVRIPLSVRPIEARRPGIIKDAGIGPAESRMAGKVLNSPGPFVLRVNCLYLFNKELHLDAWGPCWAYLLQDYLPLVFFLFYVFSVPRSKKIKKIKYTISYSWTIFRTEGPFSRFWAFLAVTLRSKDHPES